MLSYEQNVMHHLLVYCFAEARRTWWRNTHCEMSANQSESANIALPVNCRKTYSHNYLLLKTFEIASAMIHRLFDMIEISGKTVISYKVAKCDLIAAIPLWLN